MGPEFGPVFGASAGSWAKCLGPRKADLEARVLPKCQETAAIRAYASRCGEMQISA